MSVVEVETDFKPPARIVDRYVLTQVMNRHKASGGRCVACRKGYAQDPHHVVFKSAGGDDVEDNIVPLCVFCHGTFHHGLPEDREAVAENIGRALKERHIRYVLRKLGVGAGDDYLRRRYHLSVPAKLTKQMRRELM